MALPVAAPSRADLNGRYVLAIVLIIAAVICFAVFGIIGAGWVHHKSAVEFGWLGAGLVTWSFSTLVLIWPTH